MRLWPRRWKGESCRWIGLNHWGTLPIQTRTGSYRQCPTCGRRYDKRTSLAGPSA